MFHPPSMIHTVHVSYRHPHTHVRPPLVFSLVQPHFSMMFAVHVLDVQVILMRDAPYLSTPTAAIHKNVDKHGGPPDTAKRRSIHHGPIFVVASSGCTDAHISSEDRITPH